MLPRGIFDISNAHSSLALAQFLGSLDYQFSFLEHQLPAKFPSRLRWRPRDSAMTWMDSIRDWAASVAIDMTSTADTRYIRHRLAASSPSSLTQTSSESLSLFTPTTPDDDRMAPKAQSKASKAHSRGSGATKGTKKSSSHMSLSKCVFGGQLVRC